MSKSKDILIDEIKKAFPEDNRDEIAEIITTDETLFPAIDKAIKRHSREMIEEIAKNNPEIKKAIDELHPNK